jgi:hypothetical protein
MTPAQAIAALDRQLAKHGEDIVLRRRTGEPPGETYSEVTCRARLDSIDNSQAPAGILLSQFSIIVSPTQINAALWPTPDEPRIPRENDTDEVVFRSDNGRVITFCDPKFIDGVLVRLNLRCVG